MFPDCSPTPAGGREALREREGTPREEMPREEAPRGALAGRAATIGRLARELEALVVAGDVEGARVVHEAIGRLLE